MLNASVSLLQKLPLKEYAMEAAGLGGFVLFAGLLSIFLEHPRMPVMQSWMQHHGMLRRIPLGIIMGAYILLVIVLTGKRSGAHINPAVTWTFYRLGKISFRDAIGYTLAQFVGAASMALLLKATLRPWFGDPRVYYGVTAPQPPYHSMHAFIAEALITFILIAATLFAATDKVWAKRVPLITGLLIALYLIIEIPFSGMSLNPARSFAGALAANNWSHLWIYFVAPVGAAQLAGEVFLLRDRRQRRGGTMSDYKPLPHYPISEDAEQD